MEIKHRVVTDNFYDSGRVKVVAEEHLNLGRLGTDACQWEDDSGAFQSVSLTAPHVSVTANLYADPQRGWTTASVHTVTELSLSEKNIVVVLSDGSKFRLDLYWEAKDGE